MPPWKACMPCTVYQVYHSAVTASLPFAPSPFVTPLPVPRETHSPRLDPTHFFCFFSISGATLKAIDHEHYRVYAALSSSSVPHSNLDLKKKKLAQRNTQSYGGEYRETKKH